jgi:beta-phosphoglucomutase
MKIEACIFDLDGVIVDTARYHYLAWRRLARELGFDFSANENERLKGVSRMKSLEILLEVGAISPLSKSDMEKAANRKNAWYVDYISMLTPDEILPGVLDFLDELKESNIKIALGSASKNAGLILERLKITHYFDVIIDGNQVTKAKPDPEIFLSGAKALGVNAEECIVFEDAQAGIEAAKRAGMFCVGIGDTDILQSADMVLPGFKGIAWSKMQKVLIHK